MTNPKFREQEDGYCEKALAKPPASNGLLNWGSVVVSGKPAQGIEPAQPMAEIERCQQTMPMPAPATAPAAAEKERDTEPLQEERADPASQQVNNEAEQTSEEPADNPHSGNIEDIDIMEMDHDNDGNSERNAMRKAFPDRPSKAQLEGEKRDALRKATPGQPNEAEERSYHPAMNSPDEYGERCSDKVEERQDKVSPYSVNEEDRMDVRCSSRIRQPTERLLESQDQQAYG